MNAMIQGASRGIGLALVRALAANDNVDTVVASCRNPSGATELSALGDKVLVVRLDVTDETTIARAKEIVDARVGQLDLLVNAAGVLHEGDTQPERRLEHIRPESLAHAFAVNCAGPLLVSKHFWPLLRHDGRAVLASISARVGSIGDNRLGGWYGYRGSKAAQNMMTKTLSIELARRAPNVICVALHPGTVDTDLSKPFQRNVPAKTLQRVDGSAERLLEVIAGLTPEDSGRFFDWRGEPIPW